MLLLFKSIKTNYFHFSYFKIKYSGFQSNDPKEVQAYLDKVNACHKFPNGLILKPQDLEFNPNAKFFNKIISNSILGKFAQHPIKVSKKNFHHKREKKFSRFFFSFF